jgi:exonuclease III
MNAKIRTPPPPCKNRREQKPHIMPYTYKIATINISGIASQVSLTMLEEYLRQQDIDIALLQEVTNTKLTTFRRYNTHINVGTENRGTAIIAKEGLILTNTTRLPSGRGMTARFESIQIINIYATSGAEKRRESFYNSEVPTLLPRTPMEIILAGDFNCILNKADSTGQGNFSKKLEKLVRGLSLRDVYDTPTPQTNYTHFTPTGASRIDRIYITEQLRKNNSGVETMPAAFTDHMAVTIRLSIESQGTRHGNSYWKMNTLYYAKQFSCKN